MPVLRVDHTVADFDTWKQRFDADPADRRGNKVRSYALYRSVDHPDTITVDLEFDTEAEAHGMLESLEAVWRKSEAAGLIGPRQVRLLEPVESKRL